MKNKRCLLASGISLCAASLQPAAAADIDSTGTQPFNQNWSTASIWSDNATPSAGNDYFILNGHLVRTPEASGAFAFPGDSLTINSGGTLALKNRQTITVNLISAGGKITHFGTGTTPDTSRIGGTILLNNNLTIEPSNAEQSDRAIEIPADISGSGTLIKTGANLLTLSGNNSFGSGTLTFGSSSNNRGYIRLAHNNALGNVSTIALASSQGGVSGLQLEGGVTISQDLTTQGRGNATTTGYILRNVSGNNTWNGSATITAGGGGYGFLSDAGGMLTLAGTVTSTFSSTTLGVRALTFIGDGDFLVSGNIVRGGTQDSQDLNLTKDGSGTLTLSGENDYTGNTNVNAGTLVAGSSGALADTAAVAVNNAGTTLRVNFGGTGEYDEAGVFTLLAKTNFNNSATVFGIDTSNAAGDAGFTGVLDMDANFAKSGTGTLVITAANSYTGDTICHAGTLELSGANDRLPVTTTLVMSGSGELDLGTTSQTVALLATPATGLADARISGTGTLTVDGPASIEIGPGGSTTTVTSSSSAELDMSGLASFAKTNDTGEFRVGLKTGTNNTGVLGTVASVTLADSNAITASLLAVGDRSASNDGGKSEMWLGNANTLHANSINFGHSGRSDVIIAFAPGLTAPSATIRAANGNDPVSLWRIGNVATFNSATRQNFTADVDFSAGSIDAKVVNLLVGAADIGNGTNRSGIQNSFFTMGEGTLETSTLTIGRISGSGSSSIAGPMAANGTFTLDHADGILKTNSLILAENTTLAGGAGARSVSGTFELLDGTLEATTIQRGAQSGNATATATFEWTGGTIRNTADEDLTIDTVPITLIDGSHIFDATGSQTITVNSSSPVSGSGGLTKTGSGTLVLAAANSYTGTTAATAGTLRLDQANLDPDSAVALSNNAVLDLNFAGTVTVAALTINGTPMAEGTYGSTASGAANPDDTRFDGSGTLTVGTAVPGGYAGWAADNGIAGEPFTGDFDNDGLSNGLEYALAGLNPAGPDGSPGTFANGTLTFTKRPEAVANGDVTYAIETSTTLAAGSWTTVTPDVNDATTISYTLPTGQGKIFARLFVTVAP